MKMTRIPDADKLALIDQLEARNLFFKRFWSISDVFWCDSIPTAAVTSMNDKVQFLFNPEFWETLTPVGRLFIICHEQLHLMNNHFVRLRFGEGNQQLKNIAADVPINESLIRAYGFSKTDLPNHEKYVWLDTAFSYMDILPSANESAEFYYSLLLGEQQKRQQELNEQLEQMAKDGTLTDAIKESMQDALDNPSGSPQSFDDHIFSEDNHDNLSKEVRDAIEEALDELVESGKGDKSKEVDQATKRLTYKKAKKAGTADNMQSNHFDNIPVKKSRHWKRLYKGICKSIYNLNSHGHWAFQDRKMALLKTALDMPGNYRQDTLSKVKVLVYLDVSGSCVDDTEFFLRNAMSLPKELFEVSYFTFATEIEQIPIKPPYDIKCGGGTSFECIRDHVENTVKHYDAVFVFTDGEATKVTAEKPKRWFWFISPNGTASEITDGSRSFDLADFGWDEMKAKEEKNAAA